MQKRLFSLVGGLTSVSLLGLGNYAIADKNNTHHNHTSHHHKPLEITNGQAVPSVDLIVHKDRKKGWNLETKVTNFQFSPENVNKSHRLGEGHAHLYINGEKITRIYSSWYYVESLPPGKHQVTINLNANNHQPLAYKGKLIEDTETINVLSEK